MKKFYKVLDNEHALCLCDDFKVVLITTDLDSDELLYDGKKINITRDVIDTYAYIAKDERQRVVPVVKL